MIMTVEYDYATHEITIPVQVRPAPSSHADPLVFTPPVAIPNCNEQCWVLHWKLDEPSKMLVRFSGFQETDFDVPQPLELELLDLKDDYCRIKATYQDTRKKFASIDLLFRRQDKSVNDGADFSHDPTIAVTLDPVDGRSCRVPRADAVLALNN